MAVVLRDFNDATRDESNVVKQQFTLENWLAIEVRLSPFNQKVGESLVNEVASSNTITTVPKLRTMGEDLYTLVRPELNSHFPLVTKEKGGSKEEPSEKKGEKKKKKGKQQKNTGISKADQIRLDNAKSKVLETVNSVMKTFHATELMPRYAFNSDILEIRGIGFLYCAWFIMKHREQFTHPSKQPFILGIIVSIQRFINACNSYIGKSMTDNSGEMSISSRFIADLTKKFEEVKSIYHYDGFTVYDVAPELLVFTDYDNAIPTKGITPRKNQKELFHVVKNNINDGFLIFYKAMIGSGKTVSSVILGKFIEMQKKSDVAHKNMQLIFCCNLISVKNQVAQWCYNLNIKFAIAYMDSVRGLRIVNHNTCKNNAKRCVIICSPDTAFNILSNTTENEEYMLFLDEPTIGADIKGSESLKENVQVMMKMPKWTILSSATLPEQSLLEPFVTNFTDRFPTAKLENIYSNDIQIGCDVKTYNGNLVVPHLNCTTNEELAKIIVTIVKNPFLGRIYTANVVRSLWTIMTKAKISNVPNIAELFANVDNMSSDKVRQTAMSMLELLTKQPDKIVQIVCASEIFTPMNNVNKDEIEDSDGGIVWKDENEDLCDDPTSNIDLLKMGTLQSYRFLGTGLVVTPDPVEFALENFKSLLTDLAKSGIKSGYKLLDEYNTYMNIFQKNLERLQKNIENEDERSKAEQDLMENEGPKINFPDFGQINTPSHIAKYAKKHAGKLNPRNVRTAIALEKLKVNTMHVSDDILTLLFTGVGVYCPSSKYLDRNYLDTVLDLARDGKLAYLIADSSICYGTNFPINRVFITKEFAILHSINTIFQVLGRAGRVGQSWVAEAFVDLDTAKRIIAYVHCEGEDTNREAKNMNDMYNEIEKVRIDLAMKMIQKLNEAETKTNDEDETTIELVSISQIIPRDIVRKNEHKREEHQSRESRADMNRNWRDRPEDSQPPKQLYHQDNRDKYHSHQPYRHESHDRYERREEQHYGRRDRREPLPEEVPIKKEKLQEGVKPKYVPPHMRENREHSEDIKSAWKR